MEETRRSHGQLGMRVVGRLLGGPVVIGALVFLPAGTVAFWEAWVLMAILFIPTSVFTAYLARRKPALLERRLRTKEKEPEQRWIQAVSTVVLLATFVLPGLDRRFGLSAVPSGIVLCADFFVLLGYGLFVLTLNCNDYASRTVAVEEGQSVVTTGPYALVRHPMYVAVALLFGFSPLALGSYWGLIPAAFLPLVLAARIINEEQVLRRDLDGYAEYCKQVKTRLIPWVW